MLFKLFLDSIWKDCIITKKFLKKWVKINMSKDLHPSKFWLKFASSYCVEYLNVPKCFHAISAYAEK